MRAVFSTRSRARKISHQLPHLAEAAARKEISIEAFIAESVEQHINEVLGQITPIYMSRRDWRLIQQNLRLSPTPNEALLRAQADYQKLVEHEE